MRGRVYAIVGVCGAIWLSAATAAVGADLVTGDWQVEETASGPVTLERVPQVSFDGASRVSGNGGCNGFGGRYSLTPDGAISVSDVISTRRWCGGGVSDLERAVLSGLGRAVNAKADGDMLLLVGPDDAVTLRLSRKPDTQ